MEYAVKAETKEGDVIILRRGFPSRSGAEDHPVRLSLWKRVWVERVLYRARFFGHKFDLSGVLHVDFLPGETRLARAA